MTPPTANPRTEHRDVRALTDARGRLNPDAVGWSRRPFADTSGIGGRHGWGRNKRWEYWNILTPEHVIGVTISSLDYAAVHEVWMLERGTEKVWQRSATVLPARGVRLPPSLHEGVASARASGMRIEVTPTPGGTRIRARIPGVRLDVVAARSDGHDCLAVVVPWSRRRFQYTVKDLALPAQGMVELDGAIHTIAGPDAWATLDHGRGRWPYDATWNWGTGTGRAGGHVLALQVGGRWTDGTGATENGFFVDGRLTKIPEDLRWEYDRDDWLAPWRVEGGGLSARFEPFYDRVARTNLGVVSSATDQCFGTWSGTFTSSGTGTIDFAGLAGWAEHVHNRW